MEDTPRRFLEISLFECRSTLSATLRFGVRLALLDISNDLGRCIQVTMDEGEYDELSEVEKSINAWRQSERKVMIDTIQDLIQTSHKYAKSQYTPSSQRVRWTLLAGKLIWYKDQILKSFSLEALTIEMNEMKKKMIEDEQRKERDSLTRNYPLIGFRKPGDRKREDQEGVGDGEAKAGETEESKVALEKEEESVAAD